MTAKEFLRNSDSATKRAVISKVEDPQLRELLTLRYICGYDWNRIAYMMNYSYDHIVGFLHRKALKSVNMHKIALKKS